MHNQKHSEHSRLSSVALGIFVVLLSILLLGSLFLAPKCQTFDSDTLSELNTVWLNTLTDDEVSQLPSTFPVDEDGTIHIYTTLPAFEDPTYNTICFRASQAVVNVWIDGEPVFEQAPFRRSALSGKAPGSHWVMLRLPSDFAGKELRISSSSPYKEFTGLQQTIYIGSKSALLYHILHMHGLDLLMGLLFLIIGIMLLIFGLVFYFQNIRTRQIIQLSIFGILSSIWMSGESYSLQFFFRHLAFIHNLTMISLLLLPIPLIKFVAELPQFPYGRLCNWAIRLQLFYITGLFLLQLTGGPDMLDLINVSLTLLILPCVYLPFLLCYDIVRNKNRQLIIVGIAGITLGLFAFADLLCSLLALDMFVGPLMRIGTILFYLILSLYVVQTALNMYFQARQSSYYQMLSHTDQMTNCKNRRDFTEHTAAWKPGGDDAIIMIDINYLKVINDTYGHDVGDKYIKTCADILQMIFSEYGDCFRMGGDEFLFWGHHLTKEDMQELEARCSKLVLESCQTISPLCSISTGSAIYSPEDASITDTIKRADLKMYEKKRELKQIEK